jgi:hypothetical protein
VKQGAFFMTIKLSIPALQGVSAVAVETRPKQVKEWLDALRLANGFDAARKLADALVSSRAVRLGEEARLKFLDQYRQTIQLLLPSLQQEYAGKPLPLTEKSKQAANLARELLGELANGYKLVVTEIAQRKLGFGAQKHAPLAVQRATEALGEILDTCYETYAPTPAGLWVELHQLYWYAVRQKVHEEEFAEGEGRTSVNATYKRVLLTALADPYRLQHGQLRSLKAYLAHNAALAVLQPLGATESTHGLFLVRLDDDRPPKALAHHAGATDARTDILLNTIPFVRALHQQLQAVEGGKSPAEAGLPEAAADPLYRNLLKRLLTQWGLGPKRVFSRLRADSSAFICAGISSLHYALAGAGEQLPAAAPGDEEEMEITVQVAAPTDRTGQHVTYNCSNWHVVNESAGGVALSNDPQSAAKVRVGDLIGLRTGDGDAWGVAAVRWIQADTPGKVDLGAQFLAPRAEAIALRPTIAAEEAPFQPALLVPEVTALKQPERIVAQRGSFQPQREFELRVRGGSRTVRATKLVEQTDSFEIFLFG